MPRVGATAYYVGAMVLIALSVHLGAQQAPAGARQGGPPPTARSAAPIDLTGQWVSVVTEDWRWRMVTPPKGDYASIPLNPAGRKLADGWDLAADNAAGNQCRAFGAAAIMRMPTRARISWQDDSTVKLETDTGQQTRLFRFASAAPPGAATAPPATERTWQGESTAQWFRQPQTRGLGFGGRGALAGGSLRVVTRNLRPGYLRKNGVPYGEDAVVTEAFYRHDEPNGDVWFTVTTIVEDRTYLTQPFITSSSFKRETDPSKWSPTPCETAPPLEMPGRGGRGGG
ncbi:MAG: hypothetical protein HY657_11205 [Acidobacteria bacterium]|nr:hypothetical protein [Acidobacteriota bacterium]